MRAARHSRAGCAGRAPTATISIKSSAASTRCATLALLAIGVAWAYRSRPSLLGVFRSRIVGVVATAALLGLVLTLWRHVVFWKWTRQLMPSTEGRTELTVALALSVFVATTCALLRRRR
jgi:hypothetical protein